MTLTSSSRQLIFGSVFILLVFGIAAVLYLVRVQPAPPTCGDGIRNGLEQGPDCGGPDCLPCAEKYPQPLQAKMLKKLSYGSNVDVLAEIGNPNAIMDAKDFVYTFEMSDEAGKVIASRSGVYSLAAEKRFLFIESGLQASPEAKASIKAVEVKWSKKTNLTPPEIKIDIAKWGPVEGGEAGNFYVDGTVLNESLARLGKVDTVIVLYDSNGQIIGFNKIQLAEFKPFESRPFRLIWFRPVEGKVARVEGVAGAEMKYYLSQ